MNKRIVILYCLLLCIAGGLFFRMYYITSGDALITAAKSQSSYTLEPVNERGIIYDRRMQRITNTQERYIAAVMPCPEALAELSKTLTGDRRAQMIESFQDNRPFLIEVESPSLYAYGLDVFKTSSRYEDAQPAAHIVGHLQDGKGVYGIEKAYEDILSECGPSAKISYAVDVNANPLRSIPPTIVRDDSGEGVVLTLDVDIQRVVEEAASFYIKKGAVVVMDVQNGDILAAASFPTFSPNDLEPSISNEDQPFVNRFMSAYNAGSTFKILTAACALDSGISQELGYECGGGITVAGVHFGCHNLNGHGWLTMQRAMEQSCNPYFISLGQRLDVGKYLSLCEAVGFSRKSRLAPQMVTASGALPSAQTLQNRAELANFSFGQGGLTATPLQIAQLVSMVANGGKAVSPRLVVGATEDGKSVGQENLNLKPVQVISPATAGLLHSMLVSTVEKGSGTSARPDFGSAGGKTGSAQTGIYRENGREIVHAWFSGFYPAQNPRYAIVVLNEGGNAGGLVAAPVFRHIANGIAGLKR